MHHDEAGRAVRGIIDWPEAAEHEHARGGVGNVGSHGEVVHACMFVTFTRGSAPCVLPMRLRRCFLIAPTQQR
jgi:hypothetical protein